MNKAMLKLLTDILKAMRERKDPQVNVVINMPKHEQEKFDYSYMGKVIKDVAEKSITKSTPLG